ncbi:hypothetical protein YC2023_110992 [Brassica napus]
MSHAEIRRDQLREMKCEPEPGMLKEGVLHGEDIQILKSADERGGEDNLMEAIFVLMKFEVHPERISCLNQATHIDPDLKKSSQMSFITQALFQVTKSLTAKPPSSFECVISSQATRAECVPSVVPFHR